MKTIKLTLDKLNNIIAETVSSFLDGTLILEYAIKRREYYNLVHSLMQQILENYALILFYKKYQQENPNINHWKQELTAHLLNIAATNIKGGNNKKKLSVLNQLLNDFEYDNSDIINGLISGKLYSEGIDFESKECYVICNEIADNIDNLFIIMTLSQKNIIRWVRGL